MPCPYEKMRRICFGSSIRNKPKDAALHEVETLLLAFGLRRVRVQGSHPIYAYDDGITVKKIVIPLHGRKIKSLYVKRAVEIIDALIGETREDGGWFAEIKEVEGCMTQTDTWDEILPMIEEAKHLWLEVSLERGDPIPEPEKVINP